MNIIVEPPPLPLNPPQTPPPHHPSTTTHARAWHEVHPQTRKRPQAHRERTNTGTYTIARSQARTYKQKRTHTTYTDTHTQAHSIHRRARTHRGVHIHSRAHTHSKFHQTLCWSSFGQVSPKSVMEFNPREALGGNHATPPHIFALRSYCAYF